MSEKSILHLRAFMQSDVLTEQGLQLTKVFFKLRNVHDRQQVIALAERLLEDESESANSD
jgi:hypothetical protein